MNARTDADVVMEVFHAIERREFERLPDLYHPEVEFHWPPGLPHSGDFKGDAFRAASDRFSATWMPLQPTEETRQMTPRVLATGPNGRVIVHYMWKGQDARGHRFETETIGDYQIRDGRLARAQMFYYDLPGMISFLEQAAERRHT
jgi:ketosteroid isomerase-like protein